MAKKQFNSRIDEGVIAQIKHWASIDSKPKARVTDADVVEAAVVFYNKHRMGAPAADARKMGEPTPGMAARAVGAGSTDECSGCAELTRALESSRLIAGALGERIDLAEARDDGWRPSFYLKGVARRMGERLKLEPMLALDIVAGWFEDTFLGKQPEGLAEALTGESEGIGEVEVAATMALLVPGALPADGPEMGCVHCGVAFRIPVGARFTDICPGCVADGHAGDVQDCPKCGEGRAL